MMRVNIFLTLLIASIAALIALTIVGFAVFSTPQQNQNNWMSQMWGSSGMMGQTGAVQASATSQLLPYFGVLFAVLISVTIMGIVGLGYYLLLPQIGVGAMQPIALNRPASDAFSAYEAVAKTLTEEERKILMVLKAHEGKYLQKYIRNETGLSRLKTHRIIARLAERGIVSLEKTGNTNQVYLSIWLKQKN